MSLGLPVEKKKNWKKKKGQLGVSNPVRSRDFLFLFLFLFFFSFLFFVYFFLFFFRFFLFWTDGWGLEADLRPEAGWDVTMDEMSRWDVTMDEMRWDVMRWTSWDVMRWMRCHECRGTRIRESSLIETRVWIVTVASGVSNPVRSRDFFVVGKVAGSNGIRYLSSRGVFFCSHSLYMRKVQKISRPTMRPRESIALIFIDFP